VDRTIGGDSDAYPELLREHVELVMSGVAVRGDVQRLAGALLGDVERIAGRSVARMQELLPSYAKVPADALIPVTLTNTRNLLEAVRDPAADHRRADHHFRHSGETRLGQGITADEMLQAWRIGLEMVREEAHPIAKRLEVSDAVLLEFVEATLQWGDIGMRRTASAHREGEIRELERLAAEQSALRRVATLVARHAPPEELFALVTEELSRLLGVDLMVRTVRFEPDGSATILAAQGMPKDLIPPGTNTPRPGGGVLDQVFRTGRPGRVDDYAQVSGPLSVALRDTGIRSAAAGPIVVDGRTWGAMVVASQSTLPAGIEDRVAQFAELVSTAISNIESQAAVERLAAEQSALRRVATLVAREHSPDDLFATLAQELGVLLQVDAATILGYDADSTATVVAGWSDGAINIPLGERFPLEVDNLAGEVQGTGRVRRKEDYDAAAGPIAAIVRELGIRAAVASPIVVEGATWGVIAVLSRQREPLPPDTEARIAEFSRHAGVAVANAKSRSDLAQSRARIVRAGDEARRRFERDLHDGAQQRLVSLGLELRAAEATVPPELGDVRGRLSRLGTGLNNVLDHLRELSRGLHPAVLSEDGLAPALGALALRSAVPVDVRLDLGAQRFEEPVEVAAYYVASEALTNTAKHAHASRAEIRARQCDGWLELSVSDDGRGGAEAAGGSGLTGLVDRVEAIGGTIHVDSRPGLGTAVYVKLPVKSTRS
jgi:signal transduction histidine kinase